MKDTQYKKNSESHTLFVSGICSADMRTRATKMQLQ